MLLKGQKNIDELIYLTVSKSAGDSSSFRKHCQKETIGEERYFLLYMWTTLNDKKNNFRN